ncbi:helix-turn-helix transcriptional regulator [Halococcus saccharolyticus]|uniref:XRE family transcriptional regulator n=1 Tax=Halococcus saccharolyticus DSM 5350 TaxID=1227455 RepID=M0MQC7_9EURY|nr:helix-turn-helix transcriptional regulator [Halococcus saccharolyticus]EMA47932.1 XRE family transcriptional regulator [Halococcus saccharolyticus DSM 5350]
MAEGVSAKDEITPNECQALRFLSEDGWTYDELALAFGRSSDSLGDHINRDCKHDELGEPLLPIIPSGEWIRERRNAAGLNQSELAVEVGVTTTTISHWETGRTSPNVPRARRLREELGGDVYE